MSTSQPSSNDPQPPPTQSNTTPPPTSSDDFRYTFDETALENFRTEQPWNNDPKYFQKVDISPSALIKMMTHCHSGVERGIQKKGGNPIEVMGLLLGRPDPDTPRTLVVTDAFPLPIEGFETRVIADDDDVMNHMIQLGESMERTRREKFMGWYHSHPFDVGIHSHCYLSQTDISSQLCWQRAEDKNGNPFLAIVIDPLRSLAKNTPELKAFRAYPPEYKSPIPNECPDGSVVPDELARLEKWGICWSRYYVLEVNYFMSQRARHIMGILTQSYLWMRTFGSTSMNEVENRQRFPERVTAVSEKIRAVENFVLSNETLPGGSGTGGMTSSSSRGGGGTTARISTLSSSSSAARIPLSSAGGATASTSTDTNKDEGELAKACQGVVELATEKLHGNIVQLAKKDIFG